MLNGKGKKKKEVKSSRYQSMTVVMSHTVLHRIALHCIATLPSISYFIFIFFPRLSIPYPK